MISATEISPEVAKQLWENFPIHAYDVDQGTEWTLEEKSEIDLLNHDFVVLYVHNK